MILFYFKICINQVILWTKNENKSIKKFQL